MAVHAEVYIALVILLLLTIVLFLMLFQVINHLCRKQSSETHSSETKRSLLCCNITGICTFLLFSFGSVIIIIALVIEGDDTLVIYDTITRAMLLPYVFGIWIMLYIFVTRIDHTLGRSYLAYSPRTIRILYIYVIGMGLLMVFALAIHTFGDPSTGVWTILVLLNFFAHFLFVIGLMWMLGRKVFIGMRARMEYGIASETVGTPTSADAAVPKKDNPVIELNTIENWTRYTFLISVGIVSTYVGNLVSNLALSVDADPEYDGDRIILMGVDAFVNALSLYFFFEFNTAAYDKYCKTCHYGCKQCFIQCVFRCAKGDDVKTSKEAARFINLDSTNTVI
eukprot:319534_1